MQRVTEEIDGIDEIFTYDTDLLAEAMKLSRPELYELAKGTNRRGISTLRKYDLAVIVADAETYRRDSGRKAEAPAKPAETVSGAQPITTSMIEAMIEALIVARVHGYVAVNMPWEHGAGRVKSGTLCALINRNMIVGVRGNGWQFELTKHGYRALHDTGIISAQMLQDELDGIAAEIEEAHAEALDIDARQQEENERAAARDYAEFNSEQTMWLENPPAASRKLDTWLQEGMILVSPQSGFRYRFERWAGGEAVLINQENGALIRVPQSEIVHHWHYLPQASAEGTTQAVAARKLSVGDRVTHNRTGALGTVTEVTPNSVANVTPDDPRDGVWRGLFSDFTRVSGPWHRTYLRHNLTGAVVAFMGYVSEPSASHAVWVRDADGELRRMKLWVLQSDYTACCEHGNGPRETCQGCGTESEHGNQIELDEFPGDPLKIDAWRAYAQKLRVSRDASEEKVAELLAASLQPQITISAKLIRDRKIAEDKLHVLRCALAELVGRWQADGPLFERWLCGEALNDLLTDIR